MTTTIVLFTRDLRVTDHPALAAAAEAGEVVPLFVLDESILTGRYNAANRARFLADSLADLDESLRGLGARLLIRRGDPAREVVSVAHEAGAQAVVASADVSAYAQRRQRRLRQACDEAGLALSLYPGITVVQPGALAPASGDHYRVFTPYYRQWAKAAPRPLVATPSRLCLPDGWQLADSGRGDRALPTADELVTGANSPQLAPGGETEGRRRARAWLDGEIAGYSDGHDALGEDATSRLSPYLHFGCLSPAELAERAEAAREAEVREGSDGHGPAGFVRQLCFRDFHHQVLSAHPEAAHRDYRPRGDAWRRDPQAFAAWREGRTGYPIVDAGMRQLAAEGWMHNRARLVTASFLCKDLYLDWRQGAWHFFDLLVDGDVANNALNWQWVAGTGNDPRPNRVFNPVRQAQRYDLEGAYVRTWVPELAHITGSAVHTPWELAADERAKLDYPAPIVDHQQAAARFHTARGNG
jgi:deoxyribodipyrimidine photo-lyase